MYCRTIGSVRIGLALIDRPDVISTQSCPTSLTILLPSAQDLLACDTLVVVHHTDCGAVEAARRRKELSSKLWDRLCVSTNTPLVLRLTLWALRKVR